MIFRREKALVAQPFDARTLEFQGTPSVVVETVGFSPLTYQGFFSASTAGALAYLESKPGWQLVWFDRVGRRGEAAAPTGQYNGVCITQDGTRVVYDLADAQTGNIDIWSLDLARGTPSRLTFDTSVDFFQSAARPETKSSFGPQRFGTAKHRQAEDREPRRRDADSPQRGREPADGLVARRPAAGFLDVWREDELGQDRVLPLSEGECAGSLPLPPKSETRGCLPTADGSQDPFRESGRNPRGTSSLSRATGAKWQVSPNGGELSGVEPERP